MGRHVQTALIATFAIAWAHAGALPANPAPGQRFAGATDGVWYWVLPDTPGGTRPTQSWSGAGTGPRGEIYVAGMDHATNSALYRLRPGNANAPGPMLRYVGDARSASRAAANWLPGEVAEKFHTRPLSHGPRIYVANLSHSTLDDGYVQRRGFHWYAYNTNAGTFRDLSVSEPGGIAGRQVGIVSIAVDPVRNLIYGASQPTGGLYVYDIAAGRTRMLGRPNYQRPYVYVGRAMWLDRDGRLYFTAGNPSSRPNNGGPYDPEVFNHVRYYDPATRRFGEIRTWQLRNTRAVDAARCFPAVGVCYLGDNRGNVHRFTDRGHHRSSWSYVGSIDPGAGTTWVFQVSSSRAKAYLLTNSGRFFVMDLPTGRISKRLDLFALEPDLTGLQLYGYDAWDSYGRFYFAAFGRPTASFNARLVAVDPSRLLMAAASRP
jgi:hypothetical protein